MNTLDILYSFIIRGPRRNINEKQYNLENVGGFLESRRNIYDGRRDVKYSK